MDVTVLARDLVVFLAPFLPYLLKAGEKAVEEVGKKVGTNSWEQAKVLWGKLHPKVEAKPTAQEAVQDVAQVPTDEDAQAALRQQLKKLLTEDPILRDELAYLWEEAQRSGVTVTASGERAVAIGGNVQGSTIITGERNCAKIT